MEFKDEVSGRVIEGTSEASEHFFDSLREGSPNSIERFLRGENYRLSLNHWARDGLRPLHYTIETTKNQDRLEKIRLLLSKGADVDLVNKKFSSPLILACKHRIFSEMNKLLGARSPLSEDYFNSLTSYAERNYRLDVSEMTFNYRLIAYVASQLVWYDIGLVHQVPNIKNKYMVHLYEFRDAKKSGVPLEGWDSTAFLRMRIFNYLEIWVKLQRGVTQCKYKKSITDKLKTLILDMCLTVRIDYIVESLYKQNKFKAFELNKSYRFLASNIIEKELQSLGAPKSLTLSCGFSRHTIYVTFKTEIEDGRLIVTVRHDNLGAGHRLHKSIRAGAALPLVRRIEVTPDKTEGFQRDFTDFIFHLLCHKHGKYSSQSEYDALLDVIYGKNFFKKWQAESIELEECHELQTAGTCTVSNHQPVVSAHLNDPDQFSWLIAEETRTLMQDGRAEAVSDIENCDHFWYQKEGSELEHPLLQFVHLPSVDMSESIIQHVDAFNRENCRVLLDAAWGFMHRQPDGGTDKTLGKLVGDFSSTYENDKNGYCHITKQKMGEDVALLRQIRVAFERYHQAIESHYYDYVRQALDLMGTLLQAYDARHDALEAEEVIERELSQRNDEYARSRWGGEGNAQAEQNEDEVVEQNEDEVVEQNEDEVVEQNEDEIIEQNEDEIIEQNEGEIIEQNEGEAIEQNEDETIEQSIYWLDKNCLLFFRINTLFSMQHMYTLLRDQEALESVNDKLFSLIFDHRRNAVLKHNNNLKFIKDGASLSGGFLIHHTYNAKVVVEKTRRLIGDLDKLSQHYEDSRVLQAIITHRELVQESNATNVIEKHLRDKIKLIAKDNDCTARSESEALKALFHVYEEEGYEKIFKELYCLAEYYSSKSSSASTGANAYCKKAVKYYKMLQQAKPDDEYVVEQIDVLTRRLETGKSRKRPLECPTESDAKRAKYSDEAPPLATDSEPFFPAVSVMDEGKADENACSTSGYDSGVG